MQRTRILVEKQYIIFFNYSQACQLKSHQINHKIKVLVVVEGGKLKNYVL